MHDLSPHHAPHIKMKTPQCNEGHLKLVMLQQGMAMQCQVRSRVSFGDSVSRLVGQPGKQFKIAMTMWVVQAGAWADAVKWQ